MRVNTVSALILLCISFYSPLTDGAQSAACSQRVNAIGHCHGDIINAQINTQWTSSAVHWSYGFGPGPKVGDEPCVAMLHNVCDAIHDWECTFVFIYLI